MEKGDLYWVDFGEAYPDKSAYLRPALVVQSDLFNASAIGSTIVAPLSRTLRLAKSPGNVLVKLDESGLKHESVIVVSQIVSISKSRLNQHIGRIDPSILFQVDNGLKLIFDLI